MIPRDPRFSCLLSDAIYLFIPLPTNLASFEISASPVSHESACSPALSLTQVITVKNLYAQKYLDRGLRQFH